MNLKKTSFERHLSAVYPRLRRFAYTLSRNAHDADDLTQKAAMRAMSSFDKFQEGTNFDNWVFRITRNLWIDTIRARGRRGKHEMPEEAGTSVGYDPLPATEAALDLGKAMAALQKLPKDQREVVSLVLIDGMAYREAADLLELPIGTISSRVVRGRKALLELLGEKQDD